MRVRVIAVPYDSGLHRVRMGAGPDHLLDRGLIAAVEELGHEVDVTRVSLDPSALPVEIATSFAIMRGVAQRVGEARRSGAFPLVLSGNCSTAVGTVAGLDPASTAVAWFDSHGDFNTPDTTTSGFLDGMALAILTGRCWTGMSAGVPGFSPVADERVVLIGARDFDDLEAAALARSGVSLVGPSDARTSGRTGTGALVSAVTAAARTTPHMYMHIDLDVIEPSAARANALAAPGGLTPVELRGAIEVIGRHAPIAAAALTAYDPTYDPDNHVLDTAFAVVQSILKSVDDRSAGTSVAC
jgi:arginase